MGRIIGVRVRRKQTRQQEAQPTMVAIKDEDGKITEHELKTSMDELDVVYCLFPVEWRDVNPGESLEPFRPHHCKWRKLKRQEAATWDRNDPHFRELPDGTSEVCLKVPVSYEGLQPGDRVVMLLGGAGDRFAASLSRRGEEIGATVHRVPPYVFKERRGDAPKEDDQRLLSAFFEERPDAFYTVLRRHRDLIRVREAFLARERAMKERIACGQRLLQRIEGKIFLSEAGGYPEGRIEDAYDAELANDVTHRELEKEEAKRDKELRDAVHALDVWREIFAPIEGCGERIAAGVIAAIGLIQRFRVRPDLDGVTDENERRRRIRKARDRSASNVKALLGAHVLQGGKYADVPPEKSFPRKRHGQVSNWVDMGRQSLYLLTDQFNRRPESEWGKKFRNWKALYRARHPEEVIVERGDGSRKRKVRLYTDMHVHKTAFWRTASRFVEWLYDRWIRLEDAAQRQGDQPPGGTPPAPGA